MYRVILLSLGLALVMTVQAEKMSGCGRLQRGGMACCNKELVKPPPPPPAEVKECFQMPGPPPNCDMEICVAQKMGFASADGTIDKKAIIEKLDKEFEKNPEVAETIKEKCVNGDLTKYGKSDFCDLMKLKICTEHQVLKSCDDWNDEGDCKGIKDLAAECIKQYE